MNVNATEAVQSYTCANCGATTSFDPTKRTLRCPFCGTEMAVRASGAAVPTITAPQYILPFQHDKDTSVAKVREWLGDSFFAPSDLKNRSALDRGQGTYVPFWRFDAHTDADWEGEVSQTNTRQVHRMVTTSEGKSERRLVDEQHQTWHPRSGSHQGQHRAWVCGSTGLTQDEADKLMPFPEEAMKTYTPDLLVGFSSEEPGVDEAGAWQTGETRIREMERAECARQVERLTRADIRIGDRSSAVCYLPVWLYNYTYQSKQFRVLVNGYTGEIVGDRPVSRTKVIATVAAVVAVILVIVLLVVLLR